MRTILIRRILQHPEPKRAKIGQQWPSAMHPWSEILKRFASIVFVSIIYHILLWLVALKYLVLMGVINMMQKKFSTGLGIAVPVLIIHIFYIKNRAHSCCPHLEDYASALIMVGIESTIMYFLLNLWKRCDLGRVLSGTGGAILLILFYGGIVGLEYRLLIIISSKKSHKNAQEVSTYARDYVATLEMSKVETPEILILTCWSQPWVPNLLSNLRSSLLIWLIRTTELHIDW